ncbi:MAG: SPOR domain-containing protein [Alphaproteobacteria bacterium]|nr:MAG: SPOR domain-containing protein [Alphaproteobacteria bacterium]
MARGIPFGFVFALGGALALTGCDQVQMPAFLQPSAKDGAVAANATSRTVERDVEAPEVFQVTDKGLWDGRPSLGGVWVAHKDVTDPERVIIRNQDNGKFVIGVIYRPERETPGPAFQVSSDAAEALGMLAGKPAMLNVTALRREAVPEPSDAAGTGDGAAPAATAAASPAVATAPLDDPIAAAAAALDAAEAAPAVSGAPEAASRSPGAGLEKPYIQIGIFSVQSNANNTAEAMRQAGIVPTIKPGTMSGKKFWRVVVGPTTSVSERAALLRKIKELGFTDAYFVTN